jgi:hypothetical protein
VEYIILILIGCAIWYYLKTKKSPVRNPPTEIEIPIKVTISSSDGSTFASQKINSGDIVENENGFVLNPRSALPLTVHGLSRSDAIMLKDYLDEEANWGRRLSEIAFLLAQSNATCKEVADYIEKYQPQYKKTIESLKVTSPEWIAASEKDKEDMLSEYKQKALDTLPVKPAESNVLDTLFDNLPSDITANDKLLALFDGDTELYRFYVSQLWSSGQVRNIPADDYYRKKYESLVGKRLARRGLDIGIEQILNGLRLKDINEVLEGLIDKPFGRKAKAVEFAMKVTDIKERLGKTIAFRELFQLCKPEAVDVNEIQKCYEHANAIATLIRDTYVTGAHSLRTLDDAGDAKYDSWQIQAGNCCESCKAYHEKTYKRKPSKVPPFHLGCNCQVEGRYDGI